MLLTWYPSHAHGIRSSLLKYCNLIIVSLLATSTSVFYCNTSTAVSVSLVVKYRGSAVNRARTSDQFCPTKLQGIFIFRLPWSCVNEAAELEISAKTVLLTMSGSLAITCQPHTPQVSHFHFSQKNNSLHCAKSCRPFELFVNENCKL